MRTLTVLQDLRWYEEESAWMLHCRIQSPAAPTPLVPGVTDWYVRVPTNYPHGEIRWYPALAGGLVATFEHQQHNGQPPDGRPWRLGYPCVSSSNHTLGRRHLDVEPSDCDGRLAWQAGRLSQWLEHAAGGTLSAAGDPFELPCLPAGHDSRPIIAFTEDGKSLTAWEKGLSYGLVYLNSMRSDRAEYALVGQFRTLRDELACEPRWGLVAESLPTTEQAAWIRLPRLPLVAPRGIPTTWGELREHWPAKAPPLDRTLERFCDEFRGQPARYLLLGCPIPERIGSPPAAMHWLGLKLPELSKNYPGFRSQPNSLWLYERGKLFADHVKLQWVVSQNWAPAQMATRGRLRISDRSERLLLVGAGALGSALAESLVRGGFTNLEIIDNQTLAAGNLTRHSLTLSDVGRSKAVQLAARLNLAQPHARVTAAGAAFPRSDEVARATADPPFCVVDCTGEDSVLAAMETLTLPSACTWLSLSFNVTASRLYCFACNGTRFDHTAFREQIGGWLTDDARRHEGLVLPREGIGCWHPVFPARQDDVSLLAAAATKWLDEQVGGDAPASPQLTVFECNYDDARFQGMHRIDGPFPAS